jgi:uncharacterized membrane protein YkoI
MSTPRPHRLPAITATLFASAMALGIHARADARPKPGITMAEARVIALGRIPGKVVEEELEREHGRRIYSFEIAPTGAAVGAHKEVNVDANDGSIVGIEDEAADEDEHD